MVKLDRTASDWLAGRLLFLPQKIEQEIEQDLAQRDSVHPGRRQRPVRANRDGAGRAVAPPGEGVAHANCDLEDVEVLVRLQTPDDVDLGQPGRFSIRGR